MKCVSNAFYVETAFRNSLNLRHLPCFLSLFLSRWQLWRINAPCSDLWFNVKIELASFINYLFIISVFYYLLLLFPRVIISRAFGEFSFLLLQNKRKENKGFCSPKKVIKTKFIEILAVRNYKIISYLSYFVIISFWSWIFGLCVRMFTLWE